MLRRVARASDVFNQIPGRAYLLLSVLIFAAANSVTRKLTNLGEQNLIDGRNPITFCNVLFVGNLCALVALLLLYGKQLNAQSLKQLSGKDWLSLIGVAVLAGAIAPALIFQALDVTMVNNVVLIGRIEPPLSLALSVFLLGARVNVWVVAGAIVSFIGVALTIVLQPSGGNMVQIVGFQIGQGQLLAAGGAIASAIGTIISKVALSHIPLGFFSLFRTALGTVVFFTTAMILYEPAHFMDAFSPFLWQWMAIYGGVIVVGGQLCLFAGLKRSNASEGSLVNSFSPIAGILAAYLILSEAPTIAQYVGGSVIIFGIILNQIGIIHESAEHSTPSQLAPAKEMDVNVGFKGI
jgi:drug/metabolite transporter (DMT)-like permease